MRHSIILVAVCLASWCMAPSTCHAQTQRRSAVSNGAHTSVSSGQRLRGTLGQTVIGRTRSSDQQQGIGFWYRPNDGETVVTIPNTEGEIGTRLNIPILLVRSRRLVDYGPRDFVIKIRYNATVLVHESSFTCERDGDDCVLSVTGRVSDTSGVLAEVPFLVTLGNAERTSVSIDTVIWVGATTVATSTNDGVFQALGVCMEGDVVRLIKRNRAAGIVQIAPMPAANDATIGLDLVERGRTRLYLVDGAGREIAVFHDQDVAPGHVDVHADLSTTASGVYYLVLMTPNEIFARSIVVRK